jgi:hypothetical protein
VPLDLADVLDLLAAAVDQRGSACVLESLPAAGMPQRIHRYASAGQPQGIVGHAFSLTGVTGEDLELMRDESLRDLYREGRLPIEITLGALIVLDAAQRSEARGRCWGEVLDDAVSAIAKLLGLVPGLSYVNRVSGILPCRKEPHRCEFPHTTSLRAIS